MEVDDHDPLGRFIWDAFKKVENPETMSDTQRDILVNKYKSISLQNRQKFIEQVLHCLKIVLLFLAENEKGRNKKKNEHEHVLSFFVQLCVDIANIDMHAVNDEDQE